MTDQIQRTPVVEVSNNLTFIGMAAAVAVGVVVGLVGAVIILGMLGASL